MVDMRQASHDRHGRILLPNTSPHSGTCCRARHQLHAGAALADHVDLDREKSGPWRQGVLAAQALGLHHRFAKNGKRTRTVTTAEERRVSRSFYPGFRPTNPAHSIFLRESLLYLILPSTAIKGIHCSDQVKCLPCACIYHSFFPTNLQFYHLCTSYTFVQSHFISRPIRSTRHPITGSCNQASL